MGWLNSPASDTQVTHGDRLWLYIVAAIIMLLLVIPTLIVIPMSFSDSQYLEFPPSIWSVRWYEEYFGFIKVDAGNSDFITGRVSNDVGGNAIRHSSGLRTVCIRSPRSPGNFHVF